ncbi:MAG: hypothetical protein EZS28_047432, partial [Streblomastix strix]
EQTTKRTFDSPVHLTGLVHRQVQPIVSQDPLSIESGPLPNGTRNGKTYESATLKAPVKKTFSSTDDKYADGERLYGKLAELSGLNEVNLANQYLNLTGRLGEKDKLAQTLLNYRPDIHVVNSLAWFNEKGGKSRKSNFISLKTHTSAVLAQYSCMPRISDSPLIKSFY